MSYCIICNRKKVSCAIRRIGMPGFHKEGSKTEYCICCDEPPVIELCSRKGAIMVYDSTESTMIHIEKVQKLLHLITCELTVRAAHHDESKLSDPEKAVFDKWTPLLQESVYGSEEYYEILTQMKPALEHHYRYNRHHPEHFENGIGDMTLIDLTEMLCVWIAAAQRHENGDIAESLKINTERFGISKQTEKILLNTVRWLKECL